MSGLPANLGYDRRQTAAYAVLLSAPVLIALYRYPGSAERFPRWFPALASQPLGPLFAVLFQWAAFLLLAGALPLLLALLAMRLPPRGVGIAVGDLRAGAAAVAAALPLVVAPVALIASRMPGIRAEYPLARLLFQRHDLVPGYEVAYVLVYYLAWEFFFRGFLLFPLARTFGGVGAILVQTGLSCLAHIGKPEGEVLGSLLAGVGLGALALRTGSFLYGWVLHAGLGVLLDLFILFG